MAERRSTTRRSTTTGAKRPRSTRAKAVPKTKAAKAAPKSAEAGRATKAAQGAAEGASARRRPRCPAGEPNVIAVRGAREHNLRDVDIDLPRDRLVVLTGLSGSGKSSLAFDTIYAEGQRRYVESLSSYARQFLGQMDKPDVDFIEGLSPAISIDQKSASRNPRRRSARSPRSTTTCGCCSPASGSRTARSAAGSSPARRRSRSWTGCCSSPRAPASRCSRRSSGAARASTRGCSPSCRSRASPGPGSTARSSSSSDRVKNGLARYENHTIEIVVDRLVRRSGIERRLTDSLETALRLAEGVAEVEIVPKDDEAGVEPEILTFSEHLACTYDGLSFDELAPRNFSFNSPYGACERCDGLGTRFEVDPGARSSATTTSRSATARSRRGAGTAASTSTGCSTRSATSTASRSRRRGRS